MEVISGSDMMPSEVTVVVTIDTSDAEADSDIIIPIITTNDTTDTMSYQIDISSDQADITDMTTDTVDTTTAVSDGVDTADAKITTDGTVDTDDQVDTTDAVTDDVDTTNTITDHVDTADTVADSSDTTNTAPDEDTAVQEERATERDGVSEVEDSQRAGEKADEVEREGKGEDAHQTVTGVGEETQSPATATDTQAPPPSSIDQQLEGTLFFHIYS